MPKVEIAAVGVVAAVGLAAVARYVARSDDWVVVTES